MEPNISNLSKKLWKIVKVAIFMIKKGLCIKKLLMDLNLMMKRGKLASKNLANLMLHHHHHHHDDDYISKVGLATPNNNPNDDTTCVYEFSCSDTPLYRHYFTNKLKKINRHQNKNVKNPLYMPSPYYQEDGENVNLEDVSNMVDMMLHNEQVSVPSPGFTSRLGFGRSPRVRQLRVTDSPFPVHNSEEDKHVDQAAEAFITKFYSQLKQQKYN
ncbi:uncharacterized protein LOC110715466 [Chenopodium quinoa]|uniref:uncharacterized protein LOC110715466 n=1 Tax=Chenopodium quinoa TaxID=63459 RepID=UPI000B7784A7|nr:uncharacterized protein LOC110715466 [Chenopodium quinoa]